MPRLVSSAAPSSEERERAEVSGGGAPMRSGEVFPADVMKESLKMSLSMNS